MFWTYFKSDDDLELFNKYKKSLQAQESNRIESFKANHPKFQENDIVNCQPEKEKALNLTKLRMKRRIQIGEIEHQKDQTDDILKRFGTKPKYPQPH